MMASRERHENKAPLPGHESPRSSSLRSHYFPDPRGHVHGIRARLARVPRPALRGPTGRAPLVRYGDEDTTSGVTSFYGVRFRSSSSSFFRSPERFDF
ncbi:hypothetical protein NL676_030189 [Syzygium grande]|nr:hypothetical protein NL676_030189 [Syzygium grande]